MSIERTGGVGEVYREAKSIPSFFVALLGPYGSARNTGFLLEACECAMSRQGVENNRGAGGYGALEIPHESALRKKIIPEVFGKKSSWKFPCVPNREKYG